MELVFVTAGGKIESRALESGRYVIGRDTRCDLRVPSPEVSRQHCEVAVSDGLIKVRDLKSSNGTWVNAERVEESALEPGDLIAVGPVVVVVRVDGQPETIDPVLLYEQGRPRGEVRPREEAMDDSDAPSHRPTRVQDLRTDPTDDSDASSISAFEFDLDDDDDDQPPL